MKRQRRETRQLESTTGEGWGIIDTQDNVWMGTTIGPLVYVEKNVALLKALIIAEQLEFATGRLTVVYYNHGANQMRDEVEVKRSGAEALRRLESGEVTPRVLRLH